MLCKNHCQSRFSFFLVTFSVIVVLTLLCGGIAVFGAFLLEELSEPQKSVVDAALEGFQLGLSVLFGLLSGRTLTRSEELRHSANI